jgi:hypothetical protein
MVNQPATISGTRRDMPPIVPGSVVKARSAQC